MIFVINKNIEIKFGAHDPFLESPSYVFALTSNSDCLAEKLQYQFYSLTTVSRAIATFLLTCIMEHQSIIYKINDANSENL